VRHQHAGWAHQDTMLGFDERDLLRWFVDAGFVAVHLSYEHQYVRRTRRAADILAALRNRPNPTMVSYEEAAYAALGDRAEQHLAEYTRALASEPIATDEPAAYLAAQR
jgi:hypothetical protein